MGLGVVVRISIALAALPLLSGCQRFERTEECRSLWKLVNPTLREIDEQRHAKPEDARSYESISARYLLLSGAIAQLKLSYKKLQDPVVEYQRVLQEASHDARQFADALTAKDATRLAAARASAARTAKREAALVGKIDQACRQR